MKRFFTVSKEDSVDVRERNAPNPNIIHSNKIEPFSFFDFMANNRTRANSNALGCVSVPNPKISMYGKKQRK